MKAITWELGIPLWVEEMPKTSTVTTRGEPEACHAWDVEPNPLVISDFCRAMRLSIMGTRGTHGRLRQTTDGRARRTDGIERLCAPPTLQGKTALSDYLLSEVVYKERTPC